MTANNLVALINTVVETNDWIRMAGTERTWEYQVVASTAYGRVGVRDYTHTGSPVRIRVEPFQGKTFESLTRDAGWKQPGDSGQCRYSIVRPAGCEAACAVRTALAALGVGTVETVVNPDAPTWAVEVALELITPVLGQMAQDIANLRQQEAETEHQLSQGNAQADQLQAQIEALMRQLMRQREANENLYEQATSLRNERHGLNTVRGLQIEAMASLFAAGYSLGTTVSEKATVDSVEEPTGSDIDDESPRNLAEIRATQLMGMRMADLLRIYKIASGKGTMIKPKLELISMILEAEGLA